MKADSISFIDIQTDRFGSFVADYYRHISFPTLKEMGLSLVRNKSSNHDHIIHTVCFNSVAYKFLTTVINLEEDTDIATELRRRAIGYRSAAQAALKQIPLLIPSSVSLLQAFLCGVSPTIPPSHPFLHQTNPHLDIPSPRIRRRRLERGPYQGRL